MIYLEEDFPLGDWRLKETNGSRFMGATYVFLEQDVSLKYKTTNRESGDLQIKLRN